MRHPESGGGARPVLALRHVSVEFSARPSLFSPPRVIHAVEDVSLTLYAGQTTGLVGESGCGKSTLGRVAAGLLPPSGGEVLLYNAQGQAAPMRGVRPGEVQMIFQDPASSLNPRLSIGASIREPLDVAGGGLSRAGRQARVHELLTLVGLRPEQASRYPHQFSGGQRQRIVIARALARQPRLIVCDEPVSALDASVQAQVLNLLKDVQDAFDLSLLFISHDLGVIRHMSDTVAVMYLGRLVELAGAPDLFAHPAHPYTHALMEAAPRLAPGKRRRSGGEEALRGEPPSPFDPPSGCAYHPRCPRASERCCRERPHLRDVGPAHQVACFHPLFGEEDAEPAC